MNIVLINDNAEINGGASKIAILNARDLAERGHTVYFLCATTPVSDVLRHPRIRIVCTHQYEILSDPSRLRAFVQGWWNTRAWRAARALFATLDARDTIVHLHLWAKALSSSVVRAAIERGLPVVCTLHDFLLACPVGTLFVHPRQEPCRLQPMSPRCVACNCDARSYGQKLWRVGRQLVQQNVGGLPDGIADFIAHSTLVAETMRPWLPADAPVHRVPVSIEAERAAPAEVAAHERFVYVGRLVAEKGVAMLARAAAAGRLPVTYVGAGPLSTEIVALDPAARMTGWVDHAAAMRWVRASRALVFPSLWYETLGLVVLEAAAVGVPAIVPHRSAAAEYVLDGETGLLFRGGDADDLRRAMEQLRDGGLASRLGRAAYDRFWSAEYASRRAHVDALERIYARRLNARGAA